MNQIKPKQQNYDIIWSGFISYNRKKLMIGIDCYFVSGSNNNPLDDYNYTIVLENKIPPEEVLHL